MKYNGYQGVSELDLAFMELGKAYYQHDFENPVPELLPLYDRITILLNRQNAAANRMQPMPQPGYAGNGMQVSMQNVNGPMASGPAPSYNPGRAAVQPAMQPDPNAQMQQNASQPNTGMKYCRQCGQPLNANAVYCNQCGARQ